MYLCLVTKTPYFYLIRCFVCIYLVTIYFVTIYAAPPTNNESTSRLFVAALKLLNEIQGVNKAVVAIAEA